MTENDPPDAGLLSSSEPQVNNPEAVPVTPRRRRDWVPLLYIVGVLVLGGSLFWLWRNPILQPQTDTVDNRLDELQARIAQLETASKPALPDVAPILARLAALEARPARVPGASANLSGPDISGIEGRLAELEARPNAAPPDAALAVQVAQLSDRTARATRLRATGASLAAGRKLGVIPDAPEALQRFADTPPPTEAGLRLAFPEAADAALAASRPADADVSTARRFWNRAQSLVSIRQGDEVLVGDPAAGVVARARRALDAGDLAGAVGILGGLNPPAAQAMSVWLSDARALLAARAALSDLAARS